MNNKKIAIVHDWLTGMRGGEKCLEVFCELFPEATVFTLVHNKGSVTPVIENMDVRTSFLQKMPGVEKKYRTFLPLFPAAIESFDLSGYDLVLTSSHCVAKGAKSAPGTLNICYCYTPVRYAWKFFDEYFGKEKPLKKWIISQVIKRLRTWDMKTNERIDYFIAISDNIRNRIRGYYNREADVIYPPVDVDLHGNENIPVKEDYYLVVSALEPYKKVDIAIEAFNSSGKPLIVIGKGTEENKLKSISKENIKFYGWIDDSDLIKFYARSKALIFPGEEDFGIVPVEAQAYGKPVIAYGAGGVLETIIPLDSQNPTGVFFDKQNADSLNEAIESFEERRDSFSSESIKNNAHRFNRDRFQEEIKSYIEEKWELHQKDKT